MMLQGTNRDMSEMRVFVEGFKSIAPMNHPTAGRVQYVVVREKTSR